MTNVLVAGVAGASLGTEIIKCLTHESSSNRYHTYVCDISDLAYGMFDKNVMRAFLVDESDYINEVLGICIKYNIHVVIPGGEKQLKLLSSSSDRFVENNVALAINNEHTTSFCLNKNITFSKLSELGINIPKSYADLSASLLNDLSYPCIIKPSCTSGGSDNVFVCNSESDLKLYYEYMKKNDIEAIVQEYLPHDRGGEFTVGILSNKDHSVINAIAMKRVFTNKLSIRSQERGVLISSGYSQGYIDRFPNVCDTCRKIATMFQSTGPINIQGRLVDDVFYPFEINPRLSASTYLRCMAGCNEVDIYLQNLLGNNITKIDNIRYGLYLRTFSERFVDKN